eukprot:gene10478-21854_t
MDDLTVSDETQINTTPSKRNKISTQAELRALQHDLAQHDPIPVHNYALPSRTTKNTNRTMFQTMEATSQQTNPTLQPIITLLQYQAELLKITAIIDVAKVTFQPNNSCEGIQHYEYVQLQQILNNPESTEDLTSLPLFQTCTLEIGNNETYFSSTLQGMSSAILSLYLANYIKLKSEFSRIYLDDPAFVQFIIDLKQATPPEVLLEYYEMILLQAMHPTLTYPEIDISIEVIMLHISSVLKTTVLLFTLQENNTLKLSTVISNFQTYPGIPLRQLLHLHKYLCIVQESTDNYYPIPVNLTEQHYHEILLSLTTQLNQLTSYSIDHHHTQYPKIDIGQTPQTILSTLLSTSLQEITNAISDILTAPTEELQAAYSFEEANPLIPKLELSAYQLHITIKIFTVNRIINTGQGTTNAHYFIYNDNTEYLQYIPIVDGQHPTSPQAPIDNITWSTVTSSKSKRSQKTNPLPTLQPDPQPPYDQILLNRITHPSIQTNTLLFSNIPTYISTLTLHTDITTWLRTIRLKESPNSTDMTRYLPDTTLDTFSICITLTQTEHFHVSANTNAGFLPILMIYHSTSSFNTAKGSHTGYSMTIQPITTDQRKALNLLILAGIVRRISLDFLIAGHQMQSIENLVKTQPPIIPSIILLVMGITDIAITKDSKNKGKSKSSPDWQKHHFIQVYRSSTLLLCETTHSIYHHGLLYQLERTRFQKHQNTAVSAMKPIPIIRISNGHITTLQLLSLMKNILSEDLESLRFIITIQRTEHMLKYGYRKETIQPHLSQFPVHYLILESVKYQEPPDYLLQLLLTQIQQISTTIQIKPVDHLPGLNTQNTPLVGYQTAMAKAMVHGKAYKITSILNPQTTFTTPERTVLPYPPAGLHNPTTPLAHILSPFKIPPQSHISARPTPKAQHFSYSHGSTHSTPSMNSQTSYNSDPIQSPYASDTMQDIKQSMAQMSMMVTKTQINRDHQTLPRKRTITLMTTSNLKNNTSFQLSNSKYNQRRLNTTNTLRLYLKQILLNNSITLQQNPNAIIIYPPAHIRKIQNKWIKHNLVIKPSTFNNGGIGLFTGEHPIEEGSSLGFYGGYQTNTPPHNTDYTIELISLKPAYRLYTDASTTLRTHGTHGYINEYIWYDTALDPHTFQNLRFSTDGLTEIIAQYDIPPHTELTISLGKDYNWSKYKSTLLTQLIAEHNLTVKPDTQHIQIDHTINYFDLTSAQLPTDNSIRQLISYIQGDSIKPNWISITIPSYQFRKAHQPHAPQSLPIQTQQQSTNITSHRRTIPTTYQTWISQPSDYIQRTCSTLLLQSPHEIYNTASDRSPYTIHHIQIQSLINPIGLLSSIIIDTYQHQYNQRYTDHGYYMFPTTFYVSLILHPNNYQHHLRSFPNDTLDSRRHSSIVFIPLHLPNHWTLLCINYTLRQISYFDSNSNPLDPDISKIQCILNWIATDRKITHAFTIKQYIIPQQQNNFDCGLHVLMNIMIITYNWQIQRHSFIPIHIQHFRQHIWNLLFNTTFIDYTQPFNQFGQILGTMQPITLNVVTAPILIPSKTTIDLTVDSVVIPENIITPTVPSTTNNNTSPNLLTSSSNKPQELDSLISLTMQNTHIPTPISTQKPYINAVPILLHQPQYTDKFIPLQNVDTPYATNSWKDIYNQIYNYQDEPPYNSHRTQISSLSTISGSNSQHSYKTETTVGTLNTTSSCCINFHGYLKQCPICLRSSTPTLTSKIQLLDQALLTQWATRNVTQYHHTISSQHSIRISTLNINELSTEKIPIIAWFIKHCCIDILLLQDTRIAASNSLFIKKHFTQYLPTHILLFSPCSIGLKRYERVGGQITIINSKWSNNMSPFKKDHMGLGILTTTTIHTVTTTIHIHSLYSPFQNELSTHSLHNKLKQWLREQNNDLSPYDYIFNYINILTGKNPRDAHILAGDFNRLWTDPILTTWASVRNWTNPIFHYTHSNGKQPIYSKITKCSHTLIDHILLYNGTSTGYGNLYNNDIFHISDHSPIWVDILAHLPRKSPAQPTPSIKLLKFPHKNNDKVKQFQDQLEAKLIPGREPI